MIIKIYDFKRNINNPKCVYDLLTAYFKKIDKIDKDKEHFFVFHLDSRNRVKVLELMTIGTLDASLVHPREVFTRAVALRSSGIIIAHNHPSDCSEPSDNDYRITKQLKEAGKILGIEVIDHLIYTKRGFYSFREEGKI